MSKTVHYEVNLNNLPPLTNKQKIELKLFPPNNIMPFCYTVL